MENECVSVCGFGSIEISSEAISNKRNRIQRAERDIKMLMKLCLLRKYKGPMDALQSMLDRLGEARAELQVNLWRS